MHIDWDNIDTVLLDMDGTLIDRNYEDYFWYVMVPRMYAKKNNIKFKESETMLKALYKKYEGTKKLGDIDFWEKTLDMELWKIRFGMKNMVKLHPHTMHFLKFLRKHNKKIYVVSACPRIEIDFKVKTTGIADYFDGYYCENEIGKSKYENAFWERLHKKIKFDNNKTMLADDKEGVLKAAKSYGIKYLAFKAKSSSKKPAQKPNGFLYVRHFDELIQ